MFGRRQFLVGLLSCLAAPAIVQAEGLMSLRGTPLLQRSRKWVTQLEPDGSTTLVKEGQAYLDLWLQRQNSDSNSWLATVTEQIQEDKALRADRLKHWENFTAWQNVEGVSVRVEITEAGAVFSGDVVITGPYKDKPDTRYDIPVFQFAEKDW